MESPETFLHMHPVLATNEWRPFGLMMAVMNNSAPGEAGGHDWPASFDHTIHQAFFLIRILIRMFQVTTTIFVNNNHNICLVALLFYRLA